MSIRRTAMLAASFLALSPWATPAHASTQGTVQAQFVASYNQGFGGGWFATVSCKAAASTTPPGTVPPDTSAILENAQQVALATEVTCSINDTNATRPIASRSVTAAGPAAASEVTIVAPLEPLWACVSAKAAIMDSVNNRLYLATSTPPCIRLPNT